MKLRSSLGNVPVSNNFTRLLVTASLFLVLSGFPQKLKAQDKEKPQIENVKDKYFTKLLTETQREMNLEEEKNNLEINKNSTNSILKDFRYETAFIKEKKEETLDLYLDKLLAEISGIESQSKLLSFLDKNINFLTSLKQRTVVIDQEKVSAGEKEIRFDLVDTYIATLTSLKTSLSKNQDQDKLLDLLSKPSIALLLEKAKKIITQKESEYNNQISLNDSLKQDYTQLIQSVYDLEKEITDISIQLQEKNTQLNFSQQKLATFESLGTNINEKDFVEKVDLVNVISGLKKDIEDLKKKLETVNADLVVKSNQIPVKEVDIDQNIRKLSTAQKALLDEKDKQYAQISENFKQESMSMINTQDKKIENQMIVLKKSIDKYNSGIDSLTNVLQKINEEIDNQKTDEEIDNLFGSGEGVIKQREIRIQGLLREHVKYSQELENLYSIYKTVLLQNKEAIIKLEENNPFIKTDISILESEKQEMEHLIESLRVTIDAKDKEKSETKDETRVITLINELTILYSNLQRAETSLKQTESLLEQRKSFDENYFKRKDQEVEQIDKVIVYIDNNILASRHAIGSFVYGYYMQLKKMEIENLQTKISGVEKSIVSRKSSIESKTDERENIAESIELNRKSNARPVEILTKEKQLFAKRNSLASEIEGLKLGLEKDIKSLEEYKLALIELQKLFKEFALLAKEDLDAYLDFSFNGLALKEGLKNNNYPVPKKLPMDISDFASIEKLMNFIKETGLEPAFSMDDIKSLYK
ncbi:MAG: hypothetical protein PHR61_02340 [Candidatus Absconditabacteria bacterium]|nr:hypothetical protein [Candidatus Absconditabacteria bacterium]